MNNKNKPEQEVLGHRTILTFGDIQIASSENLKDTIQQTKVLMKNPKLTKYLSIEIPKKKFNLGVG